MLSMHSIMNVRKLRNCIFCGHSISTFLYVCFALLIHARVNSDTFYLPFWASNCHLRRKFPKIMTRSNSRILLWISNIPSSFKICFFFSIMLKIKDPRELVKIIFRPNFRIFQIQKKTPRLKSTYDCNDFRRWWVFWNKKIQNFSGFTLLMTCVKPFKSKNRD